MLQQEPLKDKEQEETAVLADARKNVLPLAPNESLELLLLVVQ